MWKLTPHQTKTPSSIKRCLEDHGFPPTRVEITQELGFKSSSATEEHLRALARKDAIEMTPGAFRSTRIPGFGPHAANDDEGLPVIRRATTGVPIFAERNIEELYRINPTFFNPRADYLLRACGIGMKDIGILDGDLLAVHVAREARNGQVVVTRTGGEATVKRFKREGSKVWLLTKNPEFAPIETDLEEQELIIKSLSVGAIRR